MKPISFFSSKNDIYIENEIEIDFRKMKFDE